MTDERFAATLGYINAALVDLNAARDDAPEHMIDHINDAIENLENAIATED